METYFEKYLEGIKGIIFDYGGTIDTDGRHWSWVIWEAWQKAGVASTLPVFREAYVFGERELARTLHILPYHDFHDLLLIKIKIELQWLAEQGGFPPAQIDDFASKIANLCNEAARMSVENAVPVLESLSVRYPLVLVSNFYGNINKVLETYGIRKYFKDIVESSVVGVRKPDPAIFRMGAEALELPTDECVVVGDSFRKDIIPAREAGCKAIWLKGPGWSGEEDATDYPATITNLSELVQILD